MSSVYPTASVITWAKISQYLGEVYLSRNMLLKGGDVDPTYPVLIWMERLGLEFMYTFDPTNPDIDTVTNYVYNLTKYIAEAKVIAGAGGSGGTVIPGTGTAATITGVQLEFELGTTSSPVSVNGVAVTLPVDGATSIILPLSNIIQNSILFIVGGTAVPSTPINNAVYVSISYSTTQVIITLNGFTFSNGNNYIVIGSQFVPS